MIRIILTMCFIFWIAGLLVGRYITLSGVTVTGASAYTAADLEKVYEILTVPDVDKFTVQAATVETVSTIMGVVCIPCAHSPMSCQVKCVAVLDVIKPRPSRLR